MVSVLFSPNAYIDKRLTLLNRCILEVLFNWFVNNTKQNNLIVYENDIYQWFNLKVLAEYCSCCWKTMQLNLSALTALGFLKKLKTKDNKLYLAFDFEKYKEALNSKEDLVCKRIIWIDKYLGEEKDKTMRIIRNNKCEIDSLLDTKVKEYHCCKEADAIARRILTKYPTIFRNKIPKENEIPTKTYISICQKIADIYNGHFSISRRYDFDNAVFNNKQFDTRGWREKIKAVEGDWNKVKALIFNAVENFVLMREEDRMPFNKKWLTTNLNEWFCTSNPSCRKQSQFVQSLNEPQAQKEKLDRNKALRIAEHLKKKYSMVACYAGQELDMLLPEEASESKAWQFITRIIQWGDLLWKYDKNAKYFMQCKIKGELQEGAKVLPALFARWLEENNVNTTLSTLDIERAIKCNGPWCWFMDKACRKHDINISFLRCFDEEDFYNAREASGEVDSYSYDISGFDFGDVEIPVF